MSRSFNRFSRSFVCRSIGSIVLCILCVSPFASGAANSTGYALSSSAPYSSGLAAASYRIDAGQSTFMVHAGVHGLLSSFGHSHNIAVKDFSGVAKFDPDNGSASSLELRIKAASLAVTDKIKDSDRQSIEKTMRDQVLEVSKYPDIAFKSTSVSISKTGEGQYRADMWGDLSLHGVTRRGFIRANLSLQGNT
ncbi:MAG: YceI family protein, partial [Blastocatellia bacterium]